METKRIKLSEILAAGRNGEIEMDVPATLIVAADGDSPDGELISMSSIITPTNDGSLAKRWVATASTALLKSCLKGNPKAWEALAYWHSVYGQGEREERLRAEIDEFMESLQNKEQKGEQE